MAVEKLDPAPRTWMEKTYDLAGIFVSLLIVVIVTIPWQALRTSPLYLSALFPAAFVVYLAISLLVSCQRWSKSEPFCGLKSEPL